MTKKNVCGTQPIISAENLAREAEWVGPFFNTFLPVPFINVDDVCRNHT